MTKQYTSEYYGTIKLYFNGKYIIEKRQGATLTVVRTASEQIAHEQYDKLLTSIIAHDQY